MTTVIQTDNLNKRYGDILGIQDVNLSINEGEIFGFLGPNGAGKTTTIRILTGFLKASSGQATVLGNDCWNDSVRIKAQLGFLPDSSALYENLKGNALAQLLDFGQHV